MGAQVRERPDKIHSALAASGESHSGSASLALESLQGLEIIELADIIPTAPIRSNYWTGVWIKPPEVNWFVCKFHTNPRHEEFGGMETPGFSSKTADLKRCGTRNISCPSKYPLPSVVPQL